MLCLRLQPFAAFSPRCKRSFCFCFLLTMVVEARQTFQAFDDAGLRAPVRLACGKIGNDESNLAQHVHVGHVVLEIIVVDMRAYWRLPMVAAHGYDQNAMEEEKA